MTTILLFVVLTIFLLAGLRYPLIAALAYVWLSSYYPHSGATGIFALPWTLITGIVLALSLFLNRPSEFSVRSPIFVAVVLFWAWTMVTTITALFQPVANELALEFSKVVLAFGMIAGLMTVRRNLNLLVWMLVVSAGMVAVTGTIQVVLSGGGSMVLGQPFSPYFQNNEVARLIGVSGLPFALFLSFHANSRVLRTGCAVLVFAAVIAIVGTTSRGAFVALVAFGAYLWLISKHKMKIGVFGAISVGILAVLLTGLNQQALVGRIQSIQDREVDSSYLGRVFAWNYAEDLAAKRPATGGGFGAFRGAINDERRWKDAHNIFYETLGEHGIPGALLYIAVLVTAFWRAFRLQRRFALNPDFYWERDLAIACQLSLVFFTVGGLTNSSTYAEHLFFCLAIVSGLHVCARRNADVLVRNRVKIPHAQRRLPGASRPAAGGAIGARSPARP